MYTTGYPILLWCVHKCTRGNARKEHDSTISEEIRGQHCSCWNIVVVVEISSFRERVDTFFSSKKKEKCLLRMMSSSSTAVGGSKDEGKYERRVS